jgi:hypothetical protein
MAKNILFLTYNSDDIFSKKIKDKNIDIQQIYWQKNRMCKAIRYLHLQLKLPFLSLWMGHWKKNLSKYDMVIIPASRLTPPIVSYINKISPRLHIIVWFANPVSRDYRIEPYKNLSCELWSFDKVNCTEYQMKYNTQYYFDTINILQNETLFDVIFVGADKGRLNKLLNIEYELNTMGLKTYFHITATRRENNPAYKNRVSYETIIEYISRTNVILDILQDNQSGLTLRPLEALFLSKKLITNNKDVVNYDFYDRNNIFVLGLDDKNTLFDFIKTPYKPISEENIQYYDFSKWIQRFTE